MAQKISQMTEQTTASMTEAGTSDFLGGYTTTGGNANRKFSLSGLANYFLNKFKMTLGGSSQTVKSAIDALNSKTAYSSYNLKDYLTRTDQSTDTIGRIVVFGNVVMVSMQLGGISLSVGENDIGSLSSFHPSWVSYSSGDIFAVGTHGAASIVGNLVRIHLKSNGNISVVASTAQTSTLRVTFTYATSL